MRKTWITLLALASVTAAGRAQGPATPRPSAPPATAPFDPAKNPLDRYLLRWEEAMKKVDTLALACTRKEIDKVYRTEKTYEGTIHFLKPTYFFWDMRVKGKPQEFERLIGSGQYIYQFVPAERVIRVYPAPKVGPSGTIAEDSSIAFLFGMKATAAKERYILSLFKEDKYYIYVDVIPKRDVDKADFQKARIVLNRDTFLPRQLWFEHPNAGQVIWDIPTIQSGVALPKSTFATPQTPRDWQMVKGKAEAQRLTNTPPARVIRGEQPKQ
jgi:TIGR03009 family protein